MLRWLLIFPCLLLAESHCGDRNMTLLDRYHENLCDILIDTSNSIDSYFIEEESNKSSTTHAELLTSFAIEDHQKFEKDMRLRLRLSLPKIQENLHLVFEDQSSDDALYDGTELADEKMDEKRYYLRLEYFKLVKKQLNIVFAGGVRIRNSHLVPYANIRSRYDLFDDHKSSSELSNRFRYYSDGEIEDIFEYNNKYTIDSDWDLLWRNQLSYTSEDATQIVTNDFFWVRTLNEREQVGLGVGVVSQLENFKSSHANYYHLHGLFHHMFYKSWIYYQVIPSILWREENGFKTSYRYMMNFGILFSKD